MFQRLITAVFFISSLQVFSQVVNVGDASYRADFPTSPNNYPVLNTVFWLNDAAEEFPSLSDDYSGKPIPTSDWWTSVVYHGHNMSHSSPLFAHPLSFQTHTDGLSIDYPFNENFPRAVKSFHYPDLKVGIDGMNSPECSLYDYSDWTTTIELKDGDKRLLSTIGHGLPFTYFEKQGNEKLILNAFGAVTEISNNNEVLVLSVNNVKYAAFAPSGSVWIKESVTKYTSTLNNKSYCSIALLPSVAGETTNTYPVEAVEDFRKRAYAFPVNTITNFSFNETSSKLSTNFELVTELKESGVGNLNSSYLCQYPHQWAFSSTPTKEFSYQSPRGEMKVIEGNVFTTEYTFQGVVPTLPDLGAFSTGYEEQQLRNYVTQASTQALPLTESYNQGKFFSKFIQLVHISDQLGEVSIRDNSLNKIKTALEEWLTTDASETSYLFHYNNTWNTIVGYPDGHFQASLINDHHFHWGYFIQAAACVAQYDKAWANKYGAMINLLIKDAANWDRSDQMFPHLRNMDPYAGHCWASGSGASGDGNNMESSSESMNFNTGVILWGALTENKDIRDLGVYLYSTENKAIDEYWWDVHDRTFAEGYEFEAASRVFSNGIDLLTFWTADFPEAYGINMLPIQGGSTYMGHHPDHVVNNWDDLVKNTPGGKPTLWNDIFWSYLAFADPELALSQFNSTEYSPEFAETKAHTYHWLHNLNAMGLVDTNITCDYPLANVFKKDDVTTYIVQNYSANPFKATFSDGYELMVPGDTLITSRVEGDPVGLSESSGQKVFIYPVPARDEVFISAQYKVKSVSLSTIEGRLIQELKDNHEGTMRLDLNSDLGHVQVLNITLETGESFRKKIVLK